MKKLQNNFTTPEQSKILLELGVPSDSADCYLTRFGIDEGWKAKILNNVKYSEIAISNQKYCLPCWSVGRLIEIYCLATGVEYIKISTSEISLTELMIKIIEIAVRIKTFNFSKLEE